MLDSLSSAIQERAVGFQRTYYAHVRNKLVCRALKEKCLWLNMKALVGDMEELDELWDTLMMGGKGYKLFRKLINELTLPGILNRMPPGDWKQWAKARPSCIHEDIEEAF
jgi:hypothetical protein